MKFRFQSMKFFLVVIIVVRIFLRKIFARKWLRKFWLVNNCATAVAGISLPLTIRSHTISSLVFLCSFLSLVIFNFLLLLFLFCFAVPNKHSVSTSTHSERIQFYMNSRTTNGQMNKMKKKLNKKKKTANERKTWIHRGLNKKNTSQAKEEYKRTHSNTNANSITLTKWNVKLKRRNNQAIP